VPRRAPPWTSPLATSVGARALRGIGRVSQVTPCAQDLCCVARSPMCNLYSITKGQQAIRQLAQVIRDTTGNLPWLPGVFTDYAAPIVRNAPDGARELAMARWGMPTPVFALKGRKSDSGVTNVRNVASPHWRRCLGVESRCVVPFTSFSENEVLPNGSRPPVWFALALAPLPTSLMAGSLNLTGLLRSPSAHAMVLCANQPGGQMAKLIYEKLLLNSPIFGQAGMARRGRP
jgi:hypothetical protein